ncbi:MAG: C45 family peptidase [Myxococcota bacterium]
MIRTLTLPSDPVDAGRLHGEQFRDDIRRYTDERVHLATNGSWAGRPTTRADVLGLAEEMLPAHRAYDAALYDEMVAMAAAAGISAAEAVIVGGFTDFVDAVRARGAAPTEDDCTAVIVPDARADGAGWLTQTWDMHDTATEHVVMLAPPGALVFTTVGCVGQIGMNTHGVAIGINNLTTRDGKVGVTWPFVVRKVLRQTSFDAALACVTGASLAGGHAFLLLDAEGRGASIEATSSAVEVTPLAAEPLAHTNHVIGPAMLRYEADRAPALVASSRERLARAVERCREPRLDFDAMVELTRDPTICRRSEPPFHLETSGAVVMRPRTRELWAVWRSPADHPYERFQVG